MKKTLSILCLTLLSTSAWARLPETNFFQIVSNNVKTPQRCQINFSNRTGGTGDYAVDFNLLKEDSGSNLTGNSLAFSIVENGPTSSMLNNASGDVLYVTYAKENSMTVSVITLINKLGQRTDCTDLIIIPMQ